MQTSNLYKPITLYMRKRERVECQGNSLKQFTNSNCLMENIKLELIVTIRAIVMIKIKDPRTYPITGVYAFSTHQTREVGYKNRITRHSYKQVQK